MSQHNYNSILFMLDLSPLHILTHIPIHTVHTYIHTSVFIGMTAVAVFSVDLSVAPVFVFAQELNDKMPPLLMTVADAWELADASVRKNANDKTKQPKNWKVFLYACHFFVSYSRLITFLNVLLKDITALGIVFFTGSIIHFIQVVIIIDLFRGLFLFGYFLVLLETFFFPDEIKVDIDVDVEMTANPIMTSPPPPSAMDGPPKIVEQHQVDEKTSDGHDNDDIVVSSTHDQGPTATGYNTTLVLLLLYVAQIISITIVVEIASSALL